MKRSDSVDLMKGSKSGNTGIKDVSWIRSHTASNKDYGHEKVPLKLGCDRGPYLYLSSISSSFTCQAIK